MLKRHWLVLIIGMFASFLAWADNFSPEVIAPAPWCTGPLLAYSGITAPPGTANAQVFFVSTKLYRENNLYSQAPQLDLTVGLAKRMDLEVIATYTFNSSAQQHFNGFEDVDALLTFQAIQANDQSWLPALRLAAIETFSVGNYQHLDPTKYQTDVTGQGVYQTGIGAFFTKYYHLQNDHWLNTYLTLIYTLPATTHVSGYNAYGGSEQTEGREENGGAYYVDAAVEFALSKNWVLTTDITYTYDLSDNYSGYLGVAQSGTFSGSDTATSQLITLAPGIENNFNANLGLVAGVWFTVYEHNISNFVAGIVSLNYFIG